MMHRSFSGSPFAGPSRKFMTLPALDAVVVPLAMRVRWMIAGVVVGVVSSMILGVMM